jgi:hypothetical protein
LPSGLIMGGQRQTHFPAGIDDCRGGPGALFKQVYDTSVVSAYTQELRPSPIKPLLDPIPPKIQFPIGKTVGKPYTLASLSEVCARSKPIRGKNMRLPKSLLIIYIINNKPHLSGLLCAHGTTHALRSVKTKIMKSLHKIKNPVPLALLAAALCYTSAQAAPLSRNDAVGT